MALADAQLMARHATDVRNALAAPDYPSFQARVSPTAKQELTTPVAMHVVASVLMPSLHRAAQQDYKILADRRMTAVALACRLYALDHDGRLPVFLSELVPEYLPAVPTDPLTTGNPIGYVPDPTDPIVYNVGENLKDDGGFVPPPNATRKQALQRGDDVLHLRRQPRLTVEPDGVEPVRPHGPDLPEILPPEPTLPDPTSATQPSPTGS
jgi:hypothetical protein